MNMGISESKAENDLGSPPVTCHQTLFNQTTCLFPGILHVLDSRVSSFSPSLLKNIFKTDSNYLLP